MPAAVVAIEGEEAVRLSTLPTTMTDMVTHCSQPSNKYTHLTPAGDDGYSE